MISVQEHQQNRLRLLIGTEKIADRAGQRVLLRFAPFCTIALVVTCLSLISGSLAQTQSPANSSGEGQETLSDGEHAFDFDLGAWKTHSSRLLHPLSGSKTWADMDGITVVKKVWGGRANLAEYKAEGPAGKVELLSLRWYNPEAHQWSLGFATPTSGAIGVPSVGEFKNGRGEFYDYEEINGNYVLVRFSIWGTSKNTAQSEQAFSADGGRTWEVNWINKYTRTNDQTDIDWSDDTVPDGGSHDFDFNLGTWHTQIHRIPDPFSDQSNSYDLDGTVSVRKVWGGRAQLEEIEGDGPNGHWQGLTLFLFNPKSHQWSQTFINSKMGILNSPTIGAFKNGRGELFSNDTFKNRSILVRGVWSDITANSHNYEESYSDDGGKTWSPAFIAHLTREK
jgi:hypothetical protein